MTTKPGRPPEEGYEPRMRELAKQPFLRPGGGDFDCAYAISVWDARMRVELWDLIDANPGQVVVHPSGNMGFVPSPKGDLGE